MSLDVEITQVAQSPPVRKICRLIQKFDNTEKLGENKKQRVMVQVTELNCKRRQSQ